MHWAFPIPDPVMQAWVTGSYARVAKAMSKEDADEVLTGLSCAHCYRAIRGKAFEMNGKYYDRFCWQFRYIIEHHERTQKEIREKLEQGTPIREG